MTTKQSESNTPAPRQRAATVAELHARSVQHSECPACGSKLPRTVLINHPDLILRRCRTCRLDVAEHPALMHEARSGSTPASLAPNAHRYFDGMSLANYRAYYEDLRRYGARKSFEIVSDLRGSAAASGSVLDIGCGWGWFLDEYRTRGWTVRGLEPSADMAALARDTYGLDVSTGNVESLPSLQKKFDLITLWNVLEHIPDPLAALRIIRPYLLSGGLLGLAVPNAKGLFARIARLLARLSIAAPLHTLYQVGNPHPHLYHFDTATLTRLLQRAGYTVVHTGQQEIIDPAKLHERALLEGKRAGIWAGNPLGRWAVRQVFNLSRLAHMQDEIVLYARPAEDKPGT